MEGTDEDGVAAGEADASGSGDGVGESRAQDRISARELKKKIKKAHLECVLQVGEALKKAESATDADETKMMKCP